MRKYLWVLTLAVLPLTAGCHGQIPPANPVYQCPAKDSTAFQPVNASSPASGSTYADPVPAAGQYCYGAVGNFNGGSSESSNIAGPVTAAAGQKVNLGWNALPSGYTVTIYRAAAISTTPTAPVLSVPTVSAKLKKAEGCFDCFEHEINAPTGLVAWLSNSKDTSHVR